MKSITIDNIEVTDAVIEISYWINGQDDLQSVIFKTQDFEKWLKESRRIAPNAYWDHWNNTQVSNLDSRVLINDMTQYLNYRVDMFNKPVEQPTISFTDQKPMTKVRSKVSDLRSKSSS